MTKLELAARIELATSSLLVKRSATELSEQSIISVGPGRESNSGLPHPKRKFYH